jgi:hypothetical protein
MTFMAGRRIKSNDNRARSRPAVYKKGRALKLALRALLWTILGLFILCVFLFFLLRSWTVYDSGGARIVFPWSERSAEDGNGLS